jgi:hypothetical protein
VWAPTSPTFSNAIQSCCYVDQLTLAQLEALSDGLQTLRDTPRSRRAHARPDRGVPAGR